MVGANGIPSASNGTNAAPAAALLAASGPATPSTAPLPNLPGSLEIFRSTTYEANVDSTAAGPGTSPSRKPITEPRTAAGAACRDSCPLGRSSLSRGALTGSGRRRRPTIVSASATPKTPMTRAMKLKPSARASDPRVNLK